MNQTPDACRESPGFFPLGEQSLGLFDLHCDTLTECALRGLSLRDNGLHLSLERGRRFRPWAQCFAIWIPDHCRKSEAVRRFDRIYRCFRQELEQNRDWMRPCKNRQELLCAEQEGRCAALLTVEGGAVLAGDLAQVQRLADCGVRMLTLTWNGACELGDGALVAHPKGLTAFGRAALLELERCGIVVDLSHASDPLFEQVAARAARPFVASHSNARAVCAHPRNLTDAQFLQIRACGGLVGLNLHPRFLTGQDAAGPEDLLRHTEHFLALGGEDVLALGTDFDGADLPAGMEGVQSLSQIAALFARFGYSTTLIEKIFYKNARNFFVSL